MTVLVSACRTVFFLSFCELPHQIPKMFLHYLQRVVSQMASQLRNASSPELFWDAVRSEYRDSAGHLCQAEMYKLLDSSCIVERDAGIVACSVPWQAHALSPSLPLLPPPPPCEIAQLYLWDSTALGWPTWGWISVLFCDSWFGYLFEEG